MEKKYSDLSSDEKIEYHRRKNRESYKRNIEKRKEGKKKYYDNNPGYYRKQYKNKDYKKKNACRQRTLRAVRSGRIRIEDCCSVCGVRGEIEMHHKNYDDHYDVVFVCKDCHAKIHRK